MLDLVLAGNLPKLAGIDALAAAGSLPGFRQPKDASAARQECKAKGTILYMPSYEFDDGVCKDLARGGGVVLFSFSDILREKGFRRAIMLSKMRLALAACRKAGCGTIACTLAQNAAGLRNAREILAFMAVLGMGQEEKKASVQLLAELAGGRA